MYLYLRVEKIQTFKQHRGPHWLGTAVSMAGGFEVFQKGGSLGPLTHGGQPLGAARGSRRGGFEGFFASCENVCLKKYMGRIGN